MSNEIKNKERFDFTEQTVQLWLDAEEELRKGNDDKCLELKEEFQEKYKNKHNNNERLYIDIYLESVGA